jgi:hypothetical protein
MPPTNRLTGLLILTALAAMGAAALRLDTLALGFGLLTVGVMVVMVVSAHLPAEEKTQPGLRHPTHRAYFKSIGLTGAGFFLLLITGSLVAKVDAGAACPDWPFCWGEIFPANFNPAVAILLLHRFTVVAIGILVAAVILQTRRGYASVPRLNRWAATLGLLFLTQIALGGLYSVEGIPVMGVHISI